MSLHDGLPQKVCAVCAKFIMDLYTFKEQVHQSVLTFQYVLGHHSNLSILQVVDDSTDNITQSNQLRYEDIYSNDVKTELSNKRTNNHNNSSQLEQEHNDIGSMKNCLLPTDFEQEIDRLSTNNSKSNNTNKTVAVTDSHTLKNQSKISCNICNKKFKTRREYKRHCKSKLERGNRKKRQCPICFQYVITYKMEQHKQTHKLYKQDQNIGNIEIINEDAEIESVEEDTNKNLILEHNYTKSDVSDVSDASKKYTCQICKKQFIGQREFVRHRRTEREERQLISCPFCKKNVHNFKLDSHINLNLKRKDPVDPLQLSQYTCSCCNTKFLTKIQYFFHKRKALLLNPKRITEKVSCPLCNKLINKYSLKRHVCTNLMNIKYICDVCGKTFNHRSSLEVHKLNHADKRILCDLCGKIFRSRIELKRHKIKEHEDKSLQCEICNKAFALLTDLKTHVRIHTGKRPYLCAICGKGFVQGTHLKTHTKLVHNKERLHSCPVCERRFAIKYLLDNHVDFHIYGKSARIKRGQNTCLICDKIVNNARTHNRRHTEEEPKLCEICNKVVQCPSIHAIEQHAEDKYFCHICGQSFSRMCQLGIHLKCHNEPEQYICDICHKGYKSKYFLRIHQRIHTGERPYKCNLCGKTFMHYAHCLNHIKVHRRQKDYKCPYCDKCFTLNGNLKQHIMVHTGELVHTAQTLTSEIRETLNTEQKDFSDERDVLNFDESMMGNSSNIEYLLID